MLVSTKIVSGYDYAEFNVQVPTNTEDDDPANCQFINNLNGIFQVNAAGVLDVDKAVTAVEYFFYKDLAGKKKVGNIDVTYTIEADGLELWGEATGYEKQLIAKITNSDASEGQTSAAENDYLNKIESPLLLPSIRKTTLRHVMSVLLPSMIRLLITSLMV